MPEPVVVVPPTYTRGLVVEQGLDPATHIVEIDVSLTLARQIQVSEEALAQTLSPEVIMQAQMNHAVRQMQDEAVTALGLQHWRTEVEREAKAAAHDAVFKALTELAKTVRHAPSVDAATVLVFDARDRLA